MSPRPVLEGYTITGQPGDYTATHDRIDLTLHGADQNELNMRRAIAMADDVDAILGFSAATNPWGYPQPPRSDGGSAVSSNSHLEAEQDHLHCAEMRQASQQRPGLRDLPTSDPQAEPSAGAESQADGLADEKENTP